MLGLPAAAQTARCGLKTEGEGSPTGDFNVAWHVVLLVFTQKAIADFSYNTRLLTDSQVGGAILAGDVAPISTPITFNCSIVNEKVYTQHM